MIRVDSNRLIILYLLITSLVAGYSFPEGMAYARVVKSSGELCFECHLETKKLLKKDVLHKPVNDGACIECHNPHTSRYGGLLNDSPETLCYRCHDKDDGFSGSVVHRPVEEGGCLICHDPHASNYDVLLVKDKEEVCFSCHKKEDITDKRYVHPEVGGGKCMTCHTSHTSTRHGLLIKDLKNICTTCHDGKGKGFTGAHKGYNVTKSDCQSCHSPHSSDRKGILKASLHKPFAKGNCSACHKSGSTKLLLDGKKLCLDCHKESLKSFMKIYSHLAVGGGNPCANCHNPHASDTDHLLKGKEERVCYSCHGDTARKVAESAHLHPELEKCSGCHSSHGSDEISFLNKGKDTCSTCHETQGTFTHPVGEEVKDPRSKMAMDCVTCHGPMGSPEKFILRYERDKELCVQCHQL